MQVTDIPLGRGRCKSSRWRCGSACAKRRPASHLSLGRYGEGAFEFVVKEEGEAFIRYEWARGVSGTKFITPRGSLWARCDVEANGAEMVSHIQ
ncbi:hypothetical protein TNIN_299251 [Trichonephila inaurata madagascariensis]|uniref:Uncharacterized protein n=1 Tax=Trichonephila inaurata madagascariensis TaxID=2747483 RepID=A0A8X6XDT7_9ARAC|nr:hypothetical protein TNIN_299251 [Trichonephila inaurata madagascariensis]